MAAPSVACRYQPYASSSAGALSIVSRRHRHSTYEEPGRDVQDQSAAESSFRADAGRTTGAHLVGLVEHERDHEAAHARRAAGGAQREADEDGMEDNARLQGVGRRLRLQLQRRLILRPCFSEHLKKNRWFLCSKKLSEMFNQVVLLEAFIM